MMNRLLTFLLLLSIAGFALGQSIQNTDNLLVALKKNVNKKSVRAFTFIQTTIIYKTDGSTSEELWYEAIQYPDKLRIDYESPDAGRTALYRADSVYLFRDKQLARSRYYPNDFLVIEGGILFNTVSALKERLAAVGYDLSKFREDEWEGRRVYVLGAEANDLKSRQCWFDAEHLYMVRRFNPLPNGNTFEVRYSDFKKFGSSWIESRVKFYENGILRQDEIYNDITPVKKFDPRLFDPKRLFEVHWYINK